MKGIDVRLSALRALLGAVPSSLRAFSVETAETEVRTRAIFDATATEDDRELLSAACTEIIANYPAPWTIAEEALAIPTGDEMEHLKELIFLRHEKRGASADVIVTSGCQVLD